MTRARARARGRHIFFSPLSRVNFTTGLQRRKKKAAFHFFFRRATRAAPHKFLFTPQPRRNFVLRKFAAHLWKIISVLHLKLFTSLVSGISRCITLHSDMSLLFCIHAFPAKSFYLADRWHLSLSPDRPQHDLHAPDKKLHQTAVANGCYQSKETQFV